MTISRPALPAVVERRRLGALGKAVAKNEGESLVIAPMPDWPGMLFKQYKPGTSGADRDDQLDRLIALPGDLTRADRDVLHRASCWPVARVVEGGCTIGVVIPLAPRKFSTSLQLVTRKSEAKPLEIDWLAKPAGKQRERGLPQATFAQRLTVCRDLVAVAAVLEESGVVYGDWSYANAFWSRSDFRGYLIDVDTCAFGPRPWVRTPNWEDPLTPAGVRVDNFTDRYRLALLVARCLTGERDDRAATLANIMSLSLREGRQRIGEVLRDALDARTREVRPSIASILQALDGKTGTTDDRSTEPGNGGVKHWVPLKNGKAASQRPLVAVPPRVLPRPTAPPSRPTGPSRPPQPVWPSPPRPSQPVRSSPSPVLRAFVWTVLLLLAGLVLILANHIF